MILDTVVNFDIAAPKQYQIYQVASTYHIQHAVLSSVIYIKHTLRGAKYDDLLSILRSAEEQS